MKKVPATSILSCIFCKADSTVTRSVEHIIPESLGNIDHTLPIGSVCDDCNQYFGCKIEQPLLGSEMFRMLRADRSVPNKRGRIPAFEFKEQVELPDFRLMSRFVGKVGLEVLAQRTQKVLGWNKEIVEHEHLDPLRDYVRYNKGEVWPLRYRTIYPVNSAFYNGKECYEVLHEYDLLYTSKRELYIVLALFGVEFALNMGGGDLEGYDKWLHANGGYSPPLYTGKNA